MKILKRNNLPHAARKDLDKKRPNAQSVFVLLVSELQKHFPAQIVRFANSEDALAQAIHRARDSYEAAIESKSKEVSVTLDRQIEKCAQAERAKLAKRADAHTWRRRDFMAALNATLNTRLSPVELAEVDKKMELCLSSNEAVDLVREGKLDAAEEAAKDLLIRFPDAHDGYDRLGMVYQARGERRQAAQCFRMAIEVIRRHPDDYGSSLEETFADLVDQLDQPAVT
jgi:tetratricopeptide (TPR) repeat protein